MWYQGALLVNLSGHVFCGDCTSQSWILPHIDPVAPKRVCGACFDALRRLKHRRQVELAKMVKVRADP